MLPAPFEELQPDVVSAQVLKYACVRGFLSMVLSINESESGGDSRGKDGCGAVLTYMISVSIQECTCLILKA